MKFLLSLAALLIMTGCKSDEPAPKEPKPDPLVQLRELKAEQARLLNKKFTLEKQLNKLVVNSKVDSSGSMKVVMAENQQALSDLQNIRLNHPILQKLNKDLSFWQSNQRSARAINRDQEVEDATHKIVEISGKLRNLSKELPAIREAEDRIARSEKQIASLRRELAEKTPEGQALVKQLQEIEGELAGSQ